VSKIEETINDLEEKKTNAVIEGKTKEYKDIEEKIKNAKEELEKLNKSKSIDMRCPNFKDKAVPPTKQKSFSCGILINLFNKERVCGSTVWVCNI
jgi:hypothetical protein